MTPVALMGALRAAGLTLALEGATLKVRGPTVAVAQWTPVLRQHKAALLELLTPPALDAADRQAIAEALEFDAREPRHVAEAQAHTAMRCYRILVTMDDPQPPRWVTLVAPGLSLADARHDAEGRFWGRVLEIHEQVAGGAQ
ncbi:hypothetical protein [uncultured Lamprocystis sp.]|jgi:hypothetical protein|uniref:hypothetical protein n=1 Tax=uncultured Lamprocystis sp. TaxID=543132 RepID=UPI0025F1B163|nr:hypothetical protein [uncultured Lamprocystis sp.]